MFKSYDDRDFIKRVIDLMGDSIRFENNQLYVNEVLFKKGVQVRRIL